MWRNATRLALAAFLAQTGSACSDAPDPAAPPDVPIFEGTIDLEIGEIDGDDPYLFTYIGSIVEDDRGRVIVADIRTSEIRVFERDGRFAFRFGGPGEGPGELTEPCCLEFDPDGALWVRESTRYSAFRLDSASAEYERGLGSPNPSVVAMGPFTFGADGQLVDIGPVFGGEDGSVQVRFHTRAGGGVDTVILAGPERQHISQATVPRMFGNFQGIVYLNQPYGPTWVHAHAPGGAWAEAITSEYSINYHHPDGTVSRIEGPVFQGPALSPEERTGAQTQIDRELQRADITDHPFGIPDHKPPLAGMFFDRDGRLWIEKTVADGEQMREADVYDGTTLAARYRWPYRVGAWPTPWATESRLYGVTVDSLGVQRVARVRFAPIS